MMMQKEMMCVTNNKEQINTQTNKQKKLITKPFHQTACGVGALTRK